MIKRFWFRLEEDRSEDWNISIFIFTYVLCCCRAWRCSLLPVKNLHKYRTSTFTILWRSSLTVASKTWNGHMNTVIRESPLIKSVRKHSLLMTVKSSWNQITACVLDLLQISRDLYQVHLCVAFIKSFLFWKHLTTNGNMAQPESSLRVKYSATRPQRISVNQDPIRASSSVTVKVGHIAVFVKEPLYPESFVGTLQ